MLHTMTRRQIATELGMTEAQVKYIELSALKQVRSALEALDIDGSDPELLLLFKELCNQDEAD